MQGPKRMDVTRLRAAMSERGLDAVVAVMPENVYYSSGCLLMTAWQIRDRLALCLFPNDGEPVMIVCNIEESLTRAESWIKDVRTYVEFKHSPVDALAEVLKEKGLTDKRIGIDLTYLAAAYYLHLEQQLPKIRWVASDELFQKLRAIKSPEEVNHLKRAANTTEQAIFEAFAKAHLGTTEKQMADAMNTRQLALGADENAFCVLGVGENVLHAHHAPGVKRIEESELLKVDIGARFEGYYSDVARMAVGRQPTQTQRDTYETLRDIQRSTISQLKPGVRACDVFNYCIQAFAAKGLTLNVPHIGHSLGIALHEYPMIEPGNSTELQAGMVINIEPYYVESGDAVYTLEDLVHITPAGPVILSDYSQTEQLYNIQ